jgi:hypothetical protein
MIYLGPVSHASHRGVNSTAQRYDGRPVVDAFLTGVNWGVKHTNVLTLVTTCQGQSYPSKVAELFLFPLFYRFTDCEAAAVAHSRRQLHLATDVNETLF